jgi:hypothetical protein
VAYRQRGFSAQTNSAVRNAFTASQAFFSDSPSGAVADETTLSSYGYRIDANIPLTIGGGGTINSITITGLNNLGGSTFAIDATGAWTRS